VWFGSRSNLRKLAYTDLSLTVGDDVIKPVTVVRDRGVLVDAELTMKHHISRVVSSCFFQLRRLRQIHRSVDEEVTKQLVTALILSRLDYCNAVLAGLPQSTLNHCNEYRMPLFVSSLTQNHVIIFPPSLHNSTGYLSTSALHKNCAF